MTPDRLRGERGLAWRLNYHWRQVGTGFAFFVFGFAGVVFGLTLFPLVCLPARDRVTAKRRAQWLISRWFWSFSHLMRLLGLISWEMHGVDALRRRGHLIVANHPTLIDVVLLIGQIPEVDCIVKQALFRNPFTRLPMTWAGYIGNSTPAQLVEDCAQTLKDGNSLLFFPEGTRSIPGRPIHIPHGTARIALEARMPILPVTIRCEPIMLTKHTPFWRVPPRKGHYTISVGAPASVEPYLAGAPSIAIAARRLAHDWERYFSAGLGIPAPAPPEPAVLSSADAHS